jgi:ribosome-associated protein
MEKPRPNDCYQSGNGKLYDISLPQEIPPASMSEDKPSKTQRKKAVHELRDMGEELVALNEAQLAQVEMPDFLRDAVVAARDITAHGARKRQLQYIGKLMRKVDAVPIRARLDVWNAQSRGPTLAHKRTEVWRNRLLDEEGALAELLREYPRADATYLQKLMDATARERETGHPPRSFRLLYQALHALMEKGVSR